ncbi:MAG: protein tyrosine phosphatase family protein [Verrucomicrobia bacterium]|nr:protein tyrosine phosphatase family protein [Verrucomicrobiota bacterium]
MSALELIRGYRRLDDHLATSGMPAPEHFAAMRAEGFEVVINLALPTSDFAMANEGELVSAQRMTYVHIPVNFEAPTADDFQRFASVMDAFAGRKVFVHCAANMRVSAFVFLNRMRTRSVPRAQAEADLFAIWNPDGVWRNFVNAQLASWGANPLY